MELTDNTEKNETSRIFSTTEKYSSHEWDIAHIDLDMGHTQCHWCYKNICNKAYYVREKEHCCGIPWTYNTKPVCSDCFKTYNYTGVVPA